MPRVTLGTRVKEVMVRGVLLAVTAAVLVAAASAQDLESKCEECDRSACPEVGSCPGGAVPDECGCCVICARGLGQRCDNETGAASRGRYGACGDHLVCRPRTDVGDSVEAVCECDSEGEVCGSDEVTYESLCHLLEKTADNPELFVAVRGPCKAAPVIMSPPEDAERPEGSILVLDCEVRGYPVPDVTWELNLKDGSSFKLPGDRSSLAVQVRGGPEPFMATGWVQIMRINKETVGTYSCVATNSEGEARASAKVQIRRAANEKEESLNMV
ncbi:insulin-like growth factor-binding protein-related protein 1 [Penaeus chinensis]|uniref:insulin-like growth factor-binding protein-related protein 1 n=1 Tax=Penaeus chinensis TaxID=139456 RepID=UPI001FB71E8C|nr:insulin-like growth factor-binding protein-related protein 1 [Penaeus chinensis]